MSQVRTVRQAEIVESARRIIIAKGIKSLTVREIAQELKITDGALYRHFKSKKEIIGLLIEDIEHTLLDVVDKAVDKQKDSLKKLEDIFLSHLSYAEQRKGTSFIIINETLSIKDKKLQNNMFRVLNKYLATIQSILIEGMRSGTFRKGLDPESASILFFGAVQSTVTLWGLSGQKFPLSQSYLEGVWSVYKNGILAKKV